MVGKAGWMIIEHPDIEVPQGQNKDVREGKELVICLEVSLLLGYPQWRGMEWRVYPAWHT